MVLSLNVSKIFKKMSNYGGAIFLSKKEELYGKIVIN